MVAALLGAGAALLFLSLVLVHLWQAYRARQLTQLEQTVARMLAAWSTRAPSQAESDWLEGLSSADGRLVLAFLLRRLPQSGDIAVSCARYVLRDSRLVGRVLDSLRARSALRRAEACRILGRLGRTDAISLLVERLGDRDPVVRREAVGALADLRAIDTLPAIAAAIEEMNGWSDLLAVMTLARMGPESITQISALLASSRSTAMTKALLQVTVQLGVVTDPRLVRSLARHPEMEIRVEALRVLGVIESDPASVSVCLVAMDDSEWPVRALAASSLGRLADPAAIPRLEQAMGDSAYWVRHHVAEALASMGEPGKAALSRGLAHSNPFVRDMATQALYMRAAGRREAA